MGDVPGEHLGPDGLLDSSGTRSYHRPHQCRAITGSSETPARGPRPR